MESNEFRVDYYLGKFEKGDVERVKKLNMTSAHILENVKTVNPKIYIEPLMELLNRYGLTNKYFYFIPGDVYLKNDIYCLTKTRAYDDFKSTILRSLEFDRHWNSYYDKPGEAPFEKKSNKVFWRGTTTGFIHKAANRFICVTNWWNKHDKIDVGFSFICQNKEEYAKYVKGVQTVEEFLTHKYILSIEGNDKDSGINWKLNSNSLVFMPKPRSVSWLMEDQLIPNHHYILIKDDFSDLLERYEWCEANQEECKQIIKNANEYMRIFADDANERLIEKTVLTNYINNVNP